MDSCNTARQDSLALRAFTQDASIQAAGGNVLRSASLLQLFVGLGGKE